MGRTGYEPGHRNMGITGSSLRLGGAIASFLLCIWMLSLVATSQWPLWSVFATFIPFLAGFIFLYEAASDFCVIMAWRGLYNLDDIFTSLEPVERDEHHRKDVERAKELNSAALLSAVLTTLMAYAVVRFIFLGG